MGKRLRLAVAAAAFLFSASAARADVIVTWVSVGAAGGGEFTWTYNADIPGPEQGVVAGPPPGTTTPVGPAFSGFLFADYFTIYDFSGFVQFSNIEPAGWAFQSMNVGSTPEISGAPIPGVADNAAIPNLTWYRTGDTIVGPADLGLFSARSIFNIGIPSDYAADATLTFDGTADANDGTTTVPNSLPEPATLLLMGGGLLALSLYRRRG